MESKQEGSLEQDTKDGPDLPSGQGEYILLQS